jgi:hypothetical protein
MNRSTSCIALCLLLISIAGCQKKVGDQDAIRASIEKHLTGLASINASAMDRDYKQITVNGNQAQADVEFKLKQGGATMEMTYLLERHAGDWVVLKSQPTGGQFEHPPMDKTHSAAPADDVHKGMPDIHEIIKATQAPGTKPKPAAPPAAQSAEKQTP